jgi:hypothetical protein
MIRPGVLQEAGHAFAELIHGCDKRLSLSATAISRQHGFVKRHRLVRDARHEAQPVMVPFRRSPAKPFPVLPRHRLGVPPLGSP